MIGDLDQRRRRDDLDFGAGPGCLRAAGRGTDQSFIARIRTDGSRKHTRDRRDRTVEAEFPQHCKAAQRIGRDRADGCHQSKRNGKIVMTAFLRQIGRREIDGDSPRGQGKARSDQGGADPFAGLGNRLVRQADDIESRQPRSDLDLHVHRAGLDPFKRNCGYVLDHPALAPVKA